MGFSFFEGFVGGLFSIFLEAVSQVFHDTTGFWVQAEGPWASTEGGV